MSWRTYVDGVDPFTADDVLDLQSQAVVRFPTISARTAAITAPIAGQLTWISATQTIDQWDGTAWRVLKGTPVRATVSGTAPTTTDASSATTLTVLSLPAAGTYRVRGLLRASGSFKLTSDGSVTGWWGNVRNGTDAALFDKTSADAVIDISDGANQLTGEIASTTASSWSLYYFAGSAVLNAGSVIELERVA